MIKIIKTKTWNELQKNLNELQAANVHLHKLLKGHYNKYQFELGENEGTIKKQQATIDDLKKKLRKAEHKLAEAVKKLNKQKV